MRNYRKDGTLFWNQVELNPVREPLTGEVTHFIALQTDVSLKHQAEEANALRAIELERLFRASPQGMVTLDAEGHVRLLTPAFLRMMALKPQELIGLDATGLREVLGQALGQSPEALAWPAPQARVRWTIGSGEARREIEVSCFPIGQISPEQVLYFRDISAEMGEVETRAQFLATAAHELRTPMGSICGFAELLLLREYSREQSKPLLETILRQSMRLSALINDLLDLSQMDVMGREAFPVTSVDLAEAMQRAMQVAVVPGAPRAISLQLPPAGTRVMAHPTKLEQVLINLLSNALKYSPGGGEGHLAALPVEGRNPMAPGWTIEVRDQGLGLSEEHQRRLFTRFFRADPTGPIPGTGLGLVIVKELVQRMGGDISVRSQLGVGTTFAVRLNAMPAASLSDHSNSKTPEGARSLTS